MMILAINVEGPVDHASWPLPPLKTSWGSFDQRYVVETLRSYGMWLHEICQGNMGKMMRPKNDIQCRLHRIWKRPSKKLPKQSSSLAEIFSTVYYTTPYLSAEVQMTFDMLEM